MRPLRRLPLLAAFAFGATFLSGCDGSTDAEGEAPLAAFSPATAAVVRGGGAVAGFGGVVGDSLGVNPLALLDALGVDPDAVTEVFVAAGAGAVCFDDGGIGPGGPDAPCDPSDDADAGAVVLGRFDMDALAGPNWGRHTYRGAPLVAFGSVSPNPSDSTAFTIVALTPGALYAAPTAAGVRAMLDRRAGAAPSLGDDPALARLNRRLDGRPLGLLLPDPDLLTPLLTGGNALPLTLPIAAAAVTFDVGGTGSTTALTGTAWLAPTEGSRATTLVPLLESAVALAATQPGLDADARALLGSIRFAADGPDVRMTFTVPFGAALN